MHQASDLAEKVGMEVRVLLNSHHPVIKTAKCIFINGDMYIVASMHISNIMCICLVGETCIMFYLLFLGEKVHI